MRGRRCSRMMLGAAIVGVSMAAILPGVPSEVYPPSHTWMSGTPQGRKGATLTAFLPCPGGEGRGNPLASSKQRHLLQSSLSSSLSSAPRTRHKQVCWDLWRRRRRVCCSGCNFSRTRLNTQLDQNEQEDEAPLGSQKSAGAGEEKWTATNARSDASYMKQESGAEPTAPAVRTREFGGDDISIVDKANFRNYDDAVDGGYDDEIYGEDDDYRWDQGQWVRIEDGDEDDEYYARDYDYQSDARDDRYFDDGDYEDEYEYDDEEEYSSRPNSGNFWDNPVGSADRQPQSPRRQARFFQEEEEYHSRPKRKRESKASKRRKNRSSTQFQTGNLPYAPSWLREVGYRIFFHGLPELAPDPSFRRGRFSQDILHEIDQMDIRQRRQEQQRRKRPLSGEEQEYKMSFDDDYDYEYYYEDEDDIEEEDSKRRRTPLAPLPESVDDYDEGRPTPPVNQRKSNKQRRGAPSASTRPRRSRVNAEFYDERKPSQRRRYEERSPRIPSMTDALDSLFGVDNDKVQAKAARYDQGVLGGGQRRHRRRSPSSPVDEEPPRRRKGYAYRYVDDDDQEPVADYFYEDDEEGEEEEDVLLDADLADAVSDDSVQEENIAEREPAVSSEERWMPPPEEVGAWGPNGPIEGENARTLATRRAKEEIEDAKYWLQKKQDNLTRAEQKLEEYKGLYQRHVTMSDDEQGFSGERSQIVAAIQVWSERLRQAKAQQTAADRNLSMLLSKYSVLFVEDNNDKDDAVSPPIVQDNDGDKHAEKDYN